VAPRHAAIISVGRGCNYHRPADEKRGLGMAFDGSKIWSALVDSNHGPHPYQGCARLASPYVLRFGEGLLTRC